MTLLNDPHQLESFGSGRWNTTSNPDLPFANPTGNLPQRIILDPFLHLNTDLQGLSCKAQLNLLQQKMQLSARPNGNNSHTWWNPGSTRCHLAASLMQTKHTQPFANCFPSHQRKLYYVASARSISQHRTTNVITTTKN